MACLKLGSKNDIFQKQGQAWFCTTGLPSDIIVEVGEISFHLHKFPLLSRSGVLERLIEKASNEGEDQCKVILPEIPLGSKTFELVVKFCYGVKFELTSSNVVYLCCAAHHLEMTEAYGDDNLIFQTETFLNQVVFQNWKDSLKALQTCEDALPFAREFSIEKRCIESLSMKACTDPNLFGWPVMEHGGLMQSPGGSVLWNGISTGARPRNPSSDWWYEDVSKLSFSLYKRLFLSMESRGIKCEILADSLVFYTKKYLPGISRHQAKVRFAAPMCEDDQKVLLEEIEMLIPFRKGIVSTRFLFGLLRTAMILRANLECISNLEKRIGIQLDDATLEDLLLPNFSYSMETLYNVDCVVRILEEFLAMDREMSGASSCSVDDGSPSLRPITSVAKLIDGYLAEIAPDVNLKSPKFQSLAAAIPDYARPLDDGLYRAIDIYLKSHPWLSEPEKEQVCRVMDCQKLSLEACTHAAQNERLPLRIVVQVLFFEQLHLRSSIAGCFLASGNLDESRHLRSSSAGSVDGGWATALKENEALKVGMDNMRSRVCELEKECSNMKNEIQKLGRVKGLTKWGNVQKKMGLGLGLGLSFKSQICSAQEDSVSNQARNGGFVKPENVKDGFGKRKKTLSNVY